MKPDEKSNIILICKHDKQQVIIQSLRNNFNVICLEKCSSIILLLRTKHISAIISYISNEQHNFELYIKITNVSSFVPKLAIIQDEKNLELIRKCGEIGIDKVILSSDIYELSNIINNFIDKQGLKITLEELGVNYNNVPEFLQQALLIIERSYDKLQSINEIANKLNVSYSLLACIVNKSTLPNLKKVLLLFKLRHSLYLLKHNKLTISEISNICGFSHEKRFREGLNRIFGKSPRQCQCELLSCSIDEFWKSTSSTEIN